MRHKRPKPFIDDSPDYNVLQREFSEDAGTYNVSSFLHRDRKIHRRAKAKKLKMRK